MAKDIRSTLRKALTSLQSQTAKIDRQISGLEMALGALARAPQTNPSPRRRRRMSAATRKAIGKRMKAYWSKRRAAGKGKAQSAAKK